VSIVSRDADNCKFGGYEKNIEAETGGRSVTAERDTREYRGEIQSFRVASTVSEEIAGSSCLLIFAGRINFEVAPFNRKGVFGHVLVAWSR
jgi:hypothetical protein